MSTLWAPSVTRVIPQKQKPTLSPSNEDIERVFRISLKNEKHWQCTEHADFNVQTLSVCECPDAATKMCSVSFECRWTEEAVRGVSAVPAHLGVHEDEGQLGHQLAAERAQVQLYLGAVAHRDAERVALLRLQQPALPTHIILFNAASQLS